MRIHELGHVVLYVTNLERSVHFYRDILGFAQIPSEGQRGAAAFSTGRNHHEMLLIEIGGAPKEHHGVEPGLYHIGFKVGDGPEAIKAVYAELQEKQVTIVGTADHGVTHSIYILDPDGNELELYSDVSDEWKTNPQSLFAPIKALDLE